MISEKKDFLYFEYQDFIENKSENTYLQQLFYIFYIMSKVKYSRIISIMFIYI